VGHEVEYGKGLARDLINNYTSDERREIRRLFDLIKKDPYIDGVAKIGYLVPPVVYTLYVASPQFRIFYYMKDNTVRIAFVERAVDQTPLER